jgi:drug/metabolite transporter (DMT)-like permease
LAGAFFALDMSFWHYGLVMTSVANATVLCNLTPVVVTLFAWLVWKERPRAAFVLALALAIVGAVAMGLGAPAGQGSNPLLGDLFSLSVTLWYSGYFLAVQRARRTAGALQVTLWASLAGVPLMALAALLLGEDMLPSTALGWAACVGLGFTHVVGQGGVAWALGRLPAALTAVTILVQPIVAALLGWLVFGEALAPLQALGGALVLGAVLLAQASTAKTKTGAEAKAAAPVET